MRKKKTFEKSIPWLAKFAKHYRDNLEPITYVRLLFVEIIKGDSGFEIISPPFPPEKPNAEAGKWMVQRYDLYANGIFNTPFCGLCEKEKPVIIGKLSKLTEQQSELTVESNGLGYYPDYRGMWDEADKRPCLSTARESLLSMATAAGCIGHIRKTREYLVLGCLNLSPTPHRVLPKPQKPQLPKLTEAQFHTVRTVALTLEAFEEKNFDAIFARLKAENLIIKI